MTRPAFLIAIDAEGDDVWSRPRAVTTRNARFLPRFQALCERFGFPPTYLVNYEMAGDDAFCEFAADALKRGVAEIGMHMHAWDTPPLEPLSPRDGFDQPYATKYPAALVRAKAETVTRRIEDRLGLRPVTHRAGRFGLDAAYARTLVALGYRVDCSVTPLVSWAAHPGAPDGSGGPDFRAFPSAAYRMDLDDISRAGDSSLVEIPMTIVRRPRPFAKEALRRWLGRTEPRTAWLRPNGRNLPDMRAIVAQARADGRDYVQFTLHSSELMPGGSPTFRTARSLDRLYAHMEILFEDLRPSPGVTLSRYGDEFARRAATA